MTVVRGKVVADRHYLHILSLPQSTPNIRELVAQAASCAGPLASTFNVVKVSVEDSHVSFLDYRDFFEDAFPALQRSLAINTLSGEVRLREYGDSLNPPILHRKELLLPPDHPLQSSFAAVTETAEAIGLFADPLRIGFKRSWNALVAEKGYRMQGRDLLPIGNDLEEIADTSTSDATIARHRTALSRQSLSAPVQILRRFGFLDGSRSFFDYGCGKGDDLRALTECGIRATGWDPYFLPNTERTSADIVNLGFVINVIEDRSERLTALRLAYELADQLLVVSAMLATDDGAYGKPYGDGVITSRNTFQKYFTQAELFQYISQALSEQALPMGPGIFFVFKDKGAEQAFQYGRTLNKRSLAKFNTSPRALRVKSSDRWQTIYEKNRADLDELLDIMIQLGRLPERDELSPHDRLIASIGSISRAVKVLRVVRTDGMELVAQTRAARSDDLRVYFARLRFERKRPYRALEPRLQRDIKEFFGSYSASKDAGAFLLQSLSDASLINEKCRAAETQGLGWFVESDSFQLHTSQIVRLPVELRAYVDCGTHLFGDPTSADLLKIHIRSGKLSLMRYDDFLGKALPKMVHRVKINLRTLALDVFEYGGAHPAPYLFHKSRYMNEEIEGYSEQLIAEATLDANGLHRFSGHGPDAVTFDAAMSRRRLVMSGLSIHRSTTIPTESDRCGRYLCFGDFINCGETQKRLSLDNAPRMPDSYSALVDLAMNLIDPIIDYFGMIKLTYGVSTPRLSREIKRGIAPDLDQHACHETKRNGEPISPRLGAACDFLVEDENMNEVAIWVAANTPFDRLYYYGKDRPIHVSYGPDQSREFFDMLPGKTGKIVPRRRSGIQIFQKQG